MANSHNFVVRNTFIDAVPEAKDDEVPARTLSDPTGGRSTAVQQLTRLESIHKPRPAALPEGTRAEEADEDEYDDIATEDPVENEDDEDDGLLTRTKSQYNRSQALSTSETPLKVFSPSGSTLSGRGRGSPTGRTVALNRLVPGAGTGVQATGFEDGLARAYAEGFASSPWGGYPMPYGMYHPMYNQMCSYEFGDPLALPFDGEEEGQEASASSAQLPETSDEAAAAAAMLPQSMDMAELGPGPPLGSLHSFHQETGTMGVVNSDYRQFTKVGYEGRLSVVSEARVHTDGTHRYLVQFSAGDLSRADGVGFVFSPRLPCAKNIQRIVSIFVNQRGRICMRIFADIVRASAYIKNIELGDWVEMVINLDDKVAIFNLWPQTPSGWPPLMGRPASTAEFHFGNRLGKLNQAQQKQVKLNVGHLACVVKNVGVTITLAS